MSFLLETLPIQTGAWLPRGMDTVGTDSAAGTHATYDRGNELMMALQRGERAALRELLALYNPRLYNFVFRIVKSQQLAEDLVQETWLSLYEKRDRYQPSYRFSTWLFTIARRKALSELRRRKVRSIVRPLSTSVDGEERQIEPVQETFHSPEERASGVMLKELINQALEMISVSQREVLVLRDIEGFSNDEIAEILGWQVSPGAVRKRVFDAREAFRKAIEKLGVDGSFD